MSNLEFLVEDLGARGLNSVIALNQVSDTFVGIWNLGDTGSEAPENVNFLPYKNRNSDGRIGNKDRRQQVADADIGPGGKYRSIVKLFLRYTNQKASDPWVIATGWLAAPDLVVTAGQSAYDWSYKMGRLTQVKAYVGYNGKASIGDPNVQFSQGSRVATTAEWLRSKGARAYDIAFIKLQQPFSRVMPIKFEDTPNSGLTSLGVVGYAGDLADKYTGEKGAHMYEVFSDTNWNLEDSEYAMLEYSMDPYGGNSGSPILRRDNLVSIGTHVYGGYPGSASVIGLLGNPYQNYIAAFSVEPTASRRNGLQTGTTITYVRVNITTPKQEGPQQDQGHSSQKDLSQNSFSQNGISQNGFSQNGISQNGISLNGFSQNGFPQNGFPQNGFPQNGFPQNGFPQNGFPQNGFSQNGFSQNGFSQNGFPKNGSTQSGFSQNGFPQNVSTQSRVTAEVLQAPPLAQEDESSPLVQDDKPPPLAQDDEFFEILKMGIKLSDPTLSNILEVHSPIVLGSVGSAVGALAGAILVAAGKFASFSSSLVHDFRQGLPYDGIVERAILGEAAFCVVMSMKRRRLEEEGVFANMAAVVKQISSATKRVAPYIMDTLTAPALRIALDALHNKAAGSTASYSSASSQDTPFEQSFTPSGTTLDNEAEIFVKRLSAHSVDHDDSEDYFSNSIDRIIQIGFREAGPVLTAVASEGLQSLASSLADFAVSGGNGAPSHNPHIDGLPERAMLGEAALQALMKIPTNSLEERTFDIMAKSVARIGKVVLRSAHGLIEDVGFLTKAMVTVPVGSSGEEGACCECQNPSGGEGASSEFQNPSGGGEGAYEIQKPGTGEGASEIQNLGGEGASESQNGCGEEASEFPSLSYDGASEVQNRDNRRDKGISYVNLEREVLDYYKGLETKPLPEVLE